MEHYIGKIDSPSNKNEFIDFVRLSITSESIEFEFSSNDSNHDNVNTIFGVFNGLGKATLLNCQSIGMSMGDGAYIKKYSAKYLFVGEFIDNPSLHYFDRVNIEMSGLLDWTKISAIKDDLFINKRLTIEDLETINIYNSNKFSVKIFSSYNINLKRENNQITIKENAGLKIIANKEKINIWEYLKIIKELKKLLLFISNRSSKIDKTTFYKEKNPVVLHWAGNNSLGAPSHLYPKIDFKCIQSNLNDIIDMWFTNSDIHTSIDLILEKSINSRLSGENYFLNNCFSIETYHRRFKNYKLFDNTQFKTVKANILSSIEEKELRNLIENNLAHINEPNFRKRLFDFKLDFSKVLPSNWNANEYIGKIVKTRNYLVHRSSNRNIFNKSDMLYAAIFIETIVKINIYRTIGIDDILVEKILIETGEKIKASYDSNKGNHINN